MRIEEAARTLRYRPNKTARSLAINHSGLIGVAITHLRNQFYPELVEKLSDRFAQAGYRIVLFMTRGEGDLDPVLDELFGYRLDGVVLASSSLASRLAAECAEASIPVIMLNNVDPDERSPGISADNMGGARVVAEYLLAAGHRRFGLITGAETSSASVERSAGFIEVIERAGLGSVARAAGEFSFEGAQRAARTLLGMADPPDALFCVNDHMALAALQVANELGRAVGHDLSIVGFDNVDVAAWPAFSLTTYAQPVDQMIEATVTELVGAITKKRALQSTIRIAGRLIVRNSSRQVAGLRNSEDGVRYWEP